MACLLSAFALVCALPAMATEVQFYDQDGNLLTDVNVEVLTFNANGERQIDSLQANGSGSFEIAVSEGQKAQFRVWSPGGTEYIPSDKVIPVDLSGPIPITVFQVLQDQCADAIPITLGITAGSTIGAASDPLVAGGFCGTAITNPSAGQWLSIQGTGTVLRASTCEADGNGSADYDTKISVFCLGCDDLACVAGNDDSPNCGFPVYHSTIDFCTQADTEYLIYVHGFGFSVGNFNLEVADTGVTCTPSIDCIPPEPPPPMGACCNCLAPPNNCTTESEAGCLALTNDPAAWRGEGTQCVVPGATQVDYVFPGGAIPDASLVGVTLTGEVVDDILVADLDVDLNITHSWVGDIAVILTAPDGTEAIILDQPGVPDSTFGCSQDNYDIILDDEGTGGSIEDLCSVSMVSPPNYTPFSDNGPYELSTFDGVSAAGTWTLFALDLASPDPGTINEWSLHITAGEPLCPDTSGPQGPGDGEDDGEAEDDSIYLLDTQYDRPANDGLLELGFNNLNPTDAPATTTDEVREERGGSKRSGR